jgi:UDP-hydrolysing UDP-N-acetyl-D-glucosamine 2-epimerase
VKLAVLTTGRQDWGALRSICQYVQKHPRFELQLIAGGMQCSRYFGETVRLVQEAGISVLEELKWIPDDQVPSAPEQAGEAIKMIAQALQRQRSEALLLYGDRLETAAAALAATFSMVPIIHVSGGEETLGAFDNQLRNAVTKMSHLHFVSHETAAMHVKAMGEDPGTVYSVGDPLLDNLYRNDLATRPELEAFLQGSLKPPLVIVTLHPATLGEDPTLEVGALAKAINSVEATFVITRPNSDPGHEAILTALMETTQKPRHFIVPALGERLYWGLMLIADAMVGNSSSGLVEAPAVQLPVVNVGDRQSGRLRGKNVLDVPPDPFRIATALRAALNPSFRAGLEGSSSPYGDGQSSDRIVKILEAWTPPRPPRKSSRVLYG